MKKESRIIQEDLTQIASELRDHYDDLAGKTILIAGGAGFLGRYLVSTLDFLNNNSLIDKPCKILLVDNFVSGVSAWIPDKPAITLIRHDIKERLHVDEPIDFIINAASIASPVFYNRLRLETIDAGIFGTKNLLELAVEKKVESFLFLSSSEVYGDPDPRFIPTSEEYFGNVSCVGPRACYDEPKRMGETLCINYAEIFNLPVKIARPFNIFGPGIRLDDGRVVPTFVVSAITGRRLPVHGDGLRTRTFCYISNATVGLFQILFSERNREVFNIGSDESEISIKQLAQLIHGLTLNKNGGVDLVQAATDVYSKSNPNRRCPDLSKIRTQLGYEPRIDLVTGLRRFISWAREEVDTHFGSARIVADCRVCKGQALRSFLSLGNSPLANRLLSEEEEVSGDIESYPLDVVYCPDCHHCQLSCVVEPDEMFRHYPYVTSTTETFRRHFQAMAAQIVEKFHLPARTLVVDIGSNDGLLLKHFQELGMTVIGVEPAENIVELARNNGVDTFADYFNSGAVEAIIRLKGKADVITANNVFAHIHDVDGFTEDVKSLLSEDGVLVIEVQYLLDTVRYLTFDNIYHEHVSYFSFMSLCALFEKRKMQVFDVEHVDTHGGSIRVFVQRKGGKCAVEPSVAQFIADEKDFGLDTFHTFEAFAERVYEVKHKLRKYVEDIKERQESLVGYGAPAKATTLLNFCQLGRSDIDFVVDDNPLKQGRFIPGTGIQIRGKDALDALAPDNILILAWNFAGEIIENNQSLKDNGTSFIVALPEPRIL